MSRSNIASVLAASLLLFGCGDPPENAPQDAAIDAAPPPPTPYRLTFRKGGAPPALLVARDGEGPWQPIVLDAAGVATFDVSAGYHTWAVACRPANQAPRNLRLHYEAEADPDPIVPCVGPGPTSPFVEVSGRVRPADATIRFGHDGALPDGAGGYTGTVHAGVHDIAVLAPEGPRVLLRRHEPIAGDRVFDLDAIADGFDAVSATVSIVGAGDDQVTVGADYFIATDGGRSAVLMTHNPAGVWLIPASHRVAGDRMTAFASAYSDQAGPSAISRSAQRLVAGVTVPTLELPPPSALTADRDGMGWTGTPPRIRATLLARSPGNPAISIMASRAWQTASGNSGRLAWTDPDTVPGWDPTWPHFTPGLTVSWFGALEEGDPEGDMKSVTTGLDIEW